VLAQSQGSTESCIEVGRSAVLTEWLADEGFLWDRTAVRGIGKKQESEAFEASYWFKVLKIGFSAEGCGCNLLMDLTSSTKSRKFNKNG